MRRPLLFTPLLLFIINVIGLAYAYEASPTGYYLPQGYKVSAQITVPEAPYWPGENTGDIVGLGCSEYKILVVGYGSRDIGFQVHTGIKVIKVSVGEYWNSQKVVANVNMGVEKGEYTIYIVYGSDGYIKISYSAGGTDVKPQAIYSFKADIDKYTILSQGSQVNKPEQILSSGDSNVGEGYNPLSENVVIYLALGAGVILILSIVVILVRR